MDFRQGSMEPSELVMGLIGPIGCNRAHVIETISQLAKHYGYRPIVIRVSKLIENNAKLPHHGGDQYVRVTNLIRAGNELRRQTGDNSILSKLTAKEIVKQRPTTDRKSIFIIDSIKRPEEVDELRNIYGSAFYLIAVSSSQKQREDYLRKQCHVRVKAQLDELINRDKGEDFNYGQGTSEAFHRADFFLSEDGSSTKAWNTLERFLDIIFGDPFKSPTFHEYAMYMAYGASMRSADMSRQVGAAVTVGTDILAVGANECPAPLGGTYWPVYDRSTGAISDIPGGRDYTNGYDYNAKEKDAIIASLKRELPPDAEALLDRNIKESGLSDLTEFGRVVHAEMDAILGCARRGIGTLGATLFCTTFPCHNCAKHIVASGIRKVVYVEPYPKSKAFDMHPDSIYGPEAHDEKHVLFLPFVGVGPRQFVNLFSLSLSSGAKLRRKSGDGISRAGWTRDAALPRVKALPFSYLEREATATDDAARALSAIQRIEIS